MLQARRLLSRLRCRNRCSGALMDNVLADGQASSAEYFADDGDRATDPEPIQYTMTERGSPRVTGAIAFLDCEVVGSHPCGDHTIFVGEVKDAIVGHGEPLAFFDGRFRGQGGFGSREG